MSHLYGRRCAVFLRSRDSRRRDGVRAAVALCWSLALVLAASPAPAGTLTAWSSSEATVRIEAIAEAAPPGVSGPVLRVSGATSGEVWNYGRTPTQTLQAGRRYRLSGWVRVDRVGTGTPAPSFKCEFVDSAKRSLGRTRTGIYDLSRLGSWQQLSVEFAPPQGTVGCYAALEKGVQAPTEIEALLAGGALEAISEAAAAAALPVASPLPPHPRLFLDASGFETLRGQIQTTHAAIWRTVQRRADRFAAAPPPAYEPPATPDDEQLWQRDVGNAMPYLAIAYRLTGDARYLAAAKAYALAAVSYPTWGAGKNEDIALAASHLISGVSLVYDWLQPELTAAEKTALRAAIAPRAATIHTYQSSGPGGARPLLVNSTWVRVSALAAAGFALHGEDPAAPQWSQFATTYFRGVMASLGPDGASFEGVGYWGYSVEYLLRALDLARTLGNEDLHQNDWLKKTAFYRLYLSLPLGAWSKTDSVVDLADAPRLNWYGPDYSLRGLARLFRDAHAQWLAAEIDSKGVADLDSSWLSLVWFDPALEPEAPSSLPTLRYFTDMGIVSARSGWSGSESLVVFKSGPFAGHHAMDALAYDPGAYHAHPDANHFVVFGGGEWLIRDDGYGPKSTKQHNTLLVNGRGQVGEGGKEFNGAAALAARSIARIVEARSTSALDLMTGDATQAYPKDLGVERAVRHLLFLKPDVLIVLDDIKTTKPQPLELRFHPEQAAVRLPAGAFVADGARTTLRIAPLTDDGVIATYGEVAALGDRQGTDGRLRVVRLTKSASAWRNAVALSWGRPPASVSLMRVGDRWKFEAAGRIVEFDWATSEACSYKVGEPPTCGAPPSAPDLLQAS